MTSCMAVEPDTSDIHVCLDASATGDGRDTRWLNGRPLTNTVVIRAADLGEAQKLRTRAKDGESTVTVILELEVHIAADARTARQELASSPTGAPRTVRYVGTPSGLAGLISDIKSASVADGVQIVPVNASRRVAVGHRVVAEVIPLLSPCSVESSRKIREEVTDRRTSR